MTERISDSKDVATDLARNSDPAVSDQFEKDTFVVGERYESLISKLGELEEKLSDAVTLWKQFEGACTDLIGWIDMQEGILGHNVNKDDSLPSKLQQLDICKVTEDHSENLIF